MTVPYRHPLADKTTEPIHDWKEWKEKWSASSSQQELEGLLQCGFSVSATGTDRVDRILFYLGIADGWGSGILFFKDQGLSRPADERAQAIAKKAFRVLCGVLFKEPLAWCTIEFAYHEVQEELVKGILWFFSEAAEGRNIPSDSGGKDHALDNARHFVLKFIEFIWDFEYFGEYAGGYDRLVQSLLAKYRVATIDILNKMGETKFLLGGRRKRWKMLDQACLERLRELALQRDVYQERIGKHRPAISIQEALWSGSDVAQTLIAAEMLLKEDLRQKEIREAKDQAEEAQERLRQLSGGA